MLCEYCTGDAKMACSGCKVTRYCSTECQLADWKVHKKGCKFQQVLNEVNKQYDLKPLRPTVGRCTGCNVKFDDEDYPCDDACEECGYQACESCCVHTSRGTCYCLDKNFHRPYCRMEPRWYHSNGRGVGYKGDRHPEQGYEFPPEAFETTPTECGNCGETVQLLKKEYC